MEEAAGQEQTGLNEAEVGVYSPNKPPEGLPDRVLWCIEKQ